MSQEEEDDINFKTGSEISSSKATYTVVRLLGEGGFGAVYLVEQAKTKKQFAMKVEKKMDTRKHSKLKMEIAILKLVGTCKHFTKIEDRGKKDKEGYFFIVMQLVGKSLSGLKKERPNQIFTFGTGMGVGSQCLEAVEELHKQGFIHRDLKPQNYASGQDDERHLIYILDFGIARKYLNDKKEMKTPRESVAFKASGTIRFAPLSCHRYTEMGPKDDCESWFYLLIDLILEGGLPWRHCKVKNEVLKIKENTRKDNRAALYKGIPQTSELNKILDYIDSRAYQDRIDYKFIYKALGEACSNAGCDINAPYDWEMPKEISGTSTETAKSMKK